MSVPVSSSRKTDLWNSRLGFLLAAVGSSVGLGNFWRFPYTAGDNGGGAFILTYIACVAFLALPILMAEYALGRKARVSAMTCIRDIGRERGMPTPFIAIGWIGPICAFFTLTFYNVISAWIMAFIPQSFSGRFAEFAANAGGGVTTFDIASSNFTATIGDQTLMTWLLALFVSINVFILIGGIKSGIERAAGILMPAFFVMLLGMVAYGMIFGDVVSAGAFLFSFDWSALGFDGLLSAIGQAFFSVGVGFGLMMTFGAYLKSDVDIPSASIIVVASDTMVALVAGLAIFPIVFAYGGSPAIGPGLFFVSVPSALAEIPAGALIGGVFFTLALFAALTSSISLSEVLISWLEECEGISRAGATIGLGLVLFVIGIAHIYSGAYLDLLDFITEGILLPLGGLVVSLFAGWVAGPAILDSELGKRRWGPALVFMLRWLVPLAIGVVLVAGLIARL